MTAANRLLVAMAESTNSRQRIEALYRSALELNAIDRQAFLDRVCADDESLRQEIDALLSAGAQTAAATSRQPLDSRSLPHPDLGAVIGQRQPLRLDAGHDAEGNCGESANPERPSP